MKPSPPQTFSNDHSDGKPNHGTDANNLTATTATTATTTTTTTTPGTNNTKKTQSTSPNPTNPSNSIKNNPTAKQQIINIQKNTQKVKKKIPVSFIEAGKVFVIVSSTLIALSVPEFGTWMMIIAVCGVVSLEVVHKPLFSILKQYMKDENNNPKLKNKNHPPHHQHHHHHGDEIVEKSNFCEEISPIENQQIPPPQQGKIPLETVEVVEKIEKIELVQETDEKNDEQELSCSVHPLNSTEDIQSQTDSKVSLNKVQASPIIEAQLGHLSEHLDDKSELILEKIPPKNSPKKDNEEKQLDKCLERTKSSSKQQQQQLLQKTPIKPNVDNSKSKNTQKQPLNSQKTPKKGPKEPRIEPKPTPLSLIQSLIITSPLPPDISNGFTYSMYLHSFSELILDEKNFFCIQHCISLINSHIPPNEIPNKCLQADINQFQSHILPLKDNNVNDWGNIVANMDMDDKKQFFKNFLMLLLNYLAMCSTTKTNLISETYLKDATRSDDLLDNRHDDDYDNGDDEDNGTALLDCVDMNIEHLGELNNNDANKTKNNSQNSNTTYSNSGPLTSLKPPSSQPGSSLSIASVAHSLPSPISLSRRLDRSNYPLDNFFETNCDNQNDNQNNNNIQNAQQSIPVPTSKQIISKYSTLQSNLIKMYNKQINIPTIPIGLTNLGSTCYFNATFQQLTSSFEFLSLMIQINTPMLIQNYNQWVVNLGKLYSLPGNLLNNGISSNFIENLLKKSFITSQSSLLFSHLQQLTLGTLFPEPTTTMAHPFQYPVPPPKAIMSQVDETFLKKVQIERKRNEKNKTKNDKNNPKNDVFSTISTILIDFFNTPRSDQSSLTITQSITQILTLLDSPLPHPPPIPLETPTRLYQTLSQPAQKGPRTPTTISPPQSAPCTQSAPSPPPPTLENSIYPLHFHHTPPNTPYKQPFLRPSTGIFSYFTSSDGGNVKLSQQMDANEIYLQIFNTFCEEIALLLLPYTHPLSIFCNGSGINIDGDNVKPGESYSDYSEFYLDLKNENDLKISTSSFTLPLLDPNYHPLPRTKFCNNWEINKGINEEELLRFKYQYHLLSIFCQTFSSTQIVEYLPKDCQHPRFRTQERQWAMTLTIPQQQYEECGPNIGNQLDFNNIGQNNHQNVSTSIKSHAMLNIHQCFENSFQPHCIEGLSCESCISFAMQNIVNSNSHNDQTTPHTHLTHTDQILTNIQSDNKIIDQAEKRKMTMSSTFFHPDCLPPLLTLYLPRFYYMNTNNGFKYVKDTRYIGFDTMLTKRNELKKYLFDLEKYKFMNGSFLFKNNNNDNNNDNNNNNNNNNPSPQQPNSEKCPQLSIPNLKKISKFQQHLDKLFKQRKDLLGKLNDDSNTLHNLYKLDAYINSQFCTNSTPQSLTSFIPTSNYGKYKVESVVVHRGSPQSGHYTCIKTNQSILRAQQLIFFLSMFQLQHECEHVLSYYNYDCSFNFDPTHQPSDIPIHLDGSNVQNHNIPNFPTSSHPQSISDSPHPLSISYHSFDNKLPKIPENQIFWFLCDDIAITPIQPISTLSSYTNTSIAVTARDFDLKSDRDGINMDKKTHLNTFSPHNYPFYEQHHEHSSPYTCQVCISYITSQVAGGDSQLNNPMELVNQCDNFQNNHNNNNNIRDSLSSVTGHTQNSFKSGPKSINGQGTQPSGIKDNSKYGAYFKIKQSKMRKNAQQKSIKNGESSQLEFESGLFDDDADDNNNNNINTDIDYQKSIVSIGNTVHQSHSGNHNTFQINGENKTNSQNAALTRQCAVMFSYSFFEQEEL